MKKKILLPVIVIAMAATAFKVADDIISKLGLQHQYAQTFIAQSFIGRFDDDPMRPGEREDPYTSFKVPYMRTLPSIIAGDKAGAAREMCGYIKTYVESTEFLTRYNQLKEQSFPLTDKGMTLSNLKKSKAVNELNIRNYPNDTKYVAEQQKLADEYQKRIDALLEEGKKPFYGKEDWEKMYPADPSGIIKKRLQEYLQLVATVDFNAKLAEPDKYKKRKFINPEYEKKSLKWKAIYRAGKEVNDVVIVFVKDWLKQGIKVGINPTQPAVNNTAANNTPATSSTSVISNPATNNTNAASTTPESEKQPATNTSTETKPEKKKGLKGLKDKAQKIFN